MFTSVHPKLPMRDKHKTRAFYTGQLEFRDVGASDYPDYLMLEKDGVQLHFFGFPALDPNENYGQVYIRTNNIDQLYQWMLDKQVAIHPAGHLQTKAWG